MLNNWLQSRLQIGFKIRKILKYGETYSFHEKERHFPMSAHGEVIYDATHFDALALTDNGTR